MTDNEYLKEIADTLRDIKELLAKQPAQAPARSSSSFSTPSAAQAEIPQPTELVDAPEDLQVHFGKNNGVALGKLSERSVEWYATDQPPRLDSSGNPYPPRPQEIALKNAARQLYHRRKGTLKGSAPVQEERHAPPATRQKTAAEIAEEEESVPF